MAFCIPKNLAEKLKSAAKRGEINIAELYEMNSQQRRSFFEFYTDTDTAKGINAGFERAMVSKHKNALKTWVKNTFDAKEKKKIKNLIDKVNELSNENLLDPENREAFMQDFIAERLGVTVTESEAKKINELSEKLQEEYAKGTDKYGIAKLGYWEARREMENYLQEINPASRLKIATSTIGRAAMLASLKSPLLNISGNSIVAIQQSFERRIQNTTYSGKTDKKFVREYIKTVNQIYAKSGYDVTRMQDMSDGIKTLGEEITHSQGKGATRFIGRIAENVIFDQLLSKPDVFFSSLAFADSANLAATRLAKEKGLKGKNLTDYANKVFRDATSLSPQSTDGRIVRNQARADAMLATFTNDSKLATANMGIRKALNSVTGDLKLGDQIMPFVKTPANVVSISIDASGLSAVRGITKLPRAINEMKAGDATLMREVSREMFRSGFGMTIAFIIASAFDEDDFIGAYPTSQKERELLKTKNARANSIKVGDKWVSLEYFNFIASPLIGFLYAKKYKDNLPEAMFNYAAGTSTQLLELPAIDPSKDVLDFLQDISPEGKIDKDNLPQYVANALTDYIRARTVPGIFYDIAKGLDAAEREVDYKNPLDKVKSTIPGLRQTLPEKVDVFGEVIKGEPFYSTILFGARMRSARDNRIIEEFDKLNKTGNLPSLTRPEKTSGRVKEFREQVDQEKFDAMISDFRNGYKRGVDKLISSEKFNKLSDEDKKKVIDKLKNGVLTASLKKHGYKK